MTEIKDKVELVSIDKIIKYHQNPKSHPSDQVDKIASSIKNYGFDQPIVVDGENEIIKGHGRLEAARKLGLDEVPIITQEDLSKAEVKGARLADNKTAESEWLDEELALEFDELDDMDFDLELTGFGEDEISEILEDEEIESPEAEGIDKDIEDIKILNLYAGIGGNRKFWGDLDVTAVEYNEEIAKAYQDFFPDDEVIVEDAHKYLENHFDEYDFIWTSPPCPTHSRMRKNMAVGAGAKPVFPDLNLYEEILFLQGYFEGKWLVENVISWYDPLIEPKKLGRHYYWANFDIPDTKIFSKKEVELFDEDIYGLKKWGFDLTNYKFPNDYNAKKILNNMVHPKIGEHILKSAYPKDKKSE